MSANDIRRRLDSLEGRGAGGEPVTLIVLRAMRSGNEQPQGVTYGQAGPEQWMLDRLPDETLENFYARVDETVPRGASRMPVLVSEVL
jgi:hypothetical protein